YLQDPVTIEVARSNATAATVEQRFYRVDEDDKRQALKHLLREKGVKQAFVFVNSKLGCARLARALERDGLNTTALHGDKSQDERLKALDAFKSGAVDLLICTDVAARGLDIKDVPAVFNIDIPFNAEDYVHRIGRTGRAGASGLAISFVGGRDAKLVADIEKLIGRKMEIEPIELEPERRPAGRYNDGQRLWHGDSPGGERPPRAARPPVRAPRPPQDPFFEQPYQSTLPDDVKPSWESTPKVATARGVSPYIKTRKKVAALFKRAEPEQAN
ncbi:MAG: hypothetical protein RJA09_2016, partial [Pseudomonadota bacterium]